MHSTKVKDSWNQQFTPACELYSPYRIRAAFDEWSTLNPQPIMVTLTYDQDRAAGQLICSARTDTAYRAMQAHFGLFHHLLNRRIFKSAYKRYRKVITMFPVVEQNQDEGRHFHIPMTKPDWLTISGLRGRVASSWKHGFAQVEVDNDGSFFNQYTQKLRSKEFNLESFADAFLFEYWSIN